MFVYSPSSLRNQHIAAKPPCQNINIDIDTRKLTTPDNVGLNPHLISSSTIAKTTNAFPRNQWSSCFAETMLQELARKPWCHTTANDGFVESVLGNELMRPYDD
jgi:hypothetical protein